MPDQATKTIRPRAGWRRLRAFLGLVLIALAGCFGAPAMHYDIQEYNKQVVSSEQEMLLYNVGRLNRNLPPHFMMLSSVSQTRMFSAGLSFQWSQMLNALMPTTMVARTINTLTGTPLTPAKSVTTTSANPAIAEGGAWQTGPFTAGTVENPTITFVPIQGQDFAQRFESPITDKFTLFLEDREWYATAAEKEEIVLLFVQSLVLLHGDDDKCRRIGGGLYVNELPDPLRVHKPGTQYYSALSDCVNEIVEQYQDTEQVDSGYKVPTDASAAPLATDVVSTLSVNLEWVKKGDKFELTKPIRIPAWFDYIPKFAKPPESKPQSSDALPPVWSQYDKPNWWADTGYFVPKDYKWNAYPVSIDPRKKARRVYVLMPDGYDLVRDQDGNLKQDENGEVIPKKAREIAHSATGRWTRDSTTITDTRKIAAGDVGSPIAGPGIPSDTTLLAVDATRATATMSRSAYDDSNTKMSVGHHSATGTITRDTSTITLTRGISAIDIGSPIAGPGIPPGATIVTAYATGEMASMSKTANETGPTTMTVGPRVDTGRWAIDSRTVTATKGFSEADKDSRIAGPGIAPGSTIVSVDANAKMATMSERAIDDSGSTMSVGDGDQFSRFSYGEEVVKYVSPVPQDYFYLELRKGEVDDATAKELCFGNTNPSEIDQSGLVCGYFKIGNLLQIMQRLANMACAFDDPEEIENSCPQSIFGIGPIVPSWADGSAPFTYTADGVEEKEWVWVPAHDPELEHHLAAKDPGHQDLAERDRRVFFTLYKLYQMSLVDTSKLVAGAPPVTISK